MEKIINGINTIIMPLTNLERADLREADLADVNLAGAYLGYACLQNISLIFPDGPVSSRSDVCSPMKGSEG